MDWSDIQTFLETARSGQVGVAARTLGVTDATVRHRIAALELRLGEPLFQRAGGRLTPTDTARTLEALAASIAEALGGVADDEDPPRRPVRRAVTVTATEAIGVEIVTPLLVGLQRRHPELSVTMSISLRNEDLLRGEADIAVRMSPPTQKALVSRAVGAGHFGLFASAGYLARAGIPAAVSELKRHALIGSTESTAAPSLFRAMGADVTPADFALRLESQAAQLSAVRGGAGIGVALTAIADALPELLRVLPDVRLPCPVWICMHEDLRHAAQVRLVFDAIVAAMSQPAVAGDRTAA